MIDAQLKITRGLRILEYFTLNDWRLKSSKFDDLAKTQSNEEHEMLVAEKSKTEKFNQFVCVLFCFAKVLHRHTKV
jgi:hypothetical protein